MLGWAMTLTPQEGSGEGGRQAVDTAQGQTRPGPRGCGSGPRVTQDSQPLRAPLNCIGRAGAWGFPCAAPDRDCVVWLALLCTQLWMDKKGGRLVCPTLPVWKSSLCAHEDVATKQ